MLVLEIAAGIIVAVFVLALFVGGSRRDTPADREHIKALMRAYEEVRQGKK